MIIGRTSWIHLSWIHDVLPVYGFTLNALNRLTLMAATTLVR